MKSRLLVVFLLINGLYLNAQISTNNPYSSQGIGDASFYGNAYMTGMGGASTALIDSSQTNLMNPSSYSHLAKQLPLFSLGIAHRENTFSSGDAAFKGRVTGITHMSLIIPFANRLGLAFGLKPFSRMGYEINNAEVVNEDSIFYDYEGSGEIQEFNLGFSVKIVDRRKHSFTIGANGKHYFGRVENLRRAYIINSSGVQIGGLEQKFLRARAIGYELGMNYVFKPSREHYFTLGATYRPEQQLTFNKSEARIFYSGYTNTNSYDTIIQPVATKGKVTIPDKISTGITYEYMPVSDSATRRSKLPKLLFTGEYTIENWSKYREIFGENVENPGFNNSTALRFGFEYSPHRIANDRSTFVNFYDKFSYRLGAYTVDTPYKFDDQTVVNRGVTVGIGIPIVINRAVSTVNISANYGEQGVNGNPNAVNETYYGFNLGINIAPSYDRWFNKYKLD
ncbi:MAG: hypothetical protein WED10_03100 [Brumimicrobium sp.]